MYQLRYQTTGDSEIVGNAYQFLNCRPPVGLASRTIRPMAVGSARRSLLRPAKPSISDVFIEKLKHIRFPPSDVGIEEVVSIVSGFACGRIYLSQVCFGEARQIVCHRLGRSQGIVIRGLEEHHGSS